MSSQQRTTTSRRPRPRLESLSDLIYGLSLSLGAINLVLNNGQSSTVNDINRSIIEFLFVFFILITSWIIYTADMSVLPMETRLVTFLNVILLMLVATFPYLFDQVVSKAGADVQEYASILLSLNYAVTLFILGTFAHIIAREEEHLVDGPIMVRFRRTRNVLTVLGLVVLASLATPWEWTFLQVHVRLIVWYVPIISFWINRMRASPFGISPGHSQMT